MEIDLQEIESLPDSITRNEIEQKLNALAAFAEGARNRPLKDRIILLSAIFEMADRQWNTYDLLSIDVRDKLDLVVMELWQRDSLDATEKLLGIISRLGLVRAFADLVAVDSRTLAPDVASAIQVGIAEFGKNVENPYSGM
jgi:hypothetical protein